MKILTSHFRESGRAEEVEDDVLCDDDTTRKVQEKQKGKRHRGGEI